MAKRAGSSISSGRPAGRSARVAWDLWINEGTLGNWVKADKRHRGNGTGALSEAGLAVSINLGVRPNADEYVLDHGGRLILLAEGRVVNLIAAEGNPAAVMDLSFAAQALALTWLISGQSGLAAGVYPMPPEIDVEVARLALNARGARIDQLTTGQLEYLASWRQGS